jgi:hypothetical protein
MFENKYPQTVDEWALFDNMRGVENAAATMTQMLLKRTKAAKVAWAESDDPGLDLKYFAHKELHTLLVHDFAKFVEYGAQDTEPENAASEGMETLLGFTYMTLDRFVATLGVKCPRCPIKGGSNADSK